MANIHQVMIGDIRCVVLQEGGRETTNPKPEDITARYTNPTAAEIADALDGVDVIRGSLSPLYIDTGTSKILADVGFGTNGPATMGGVIPALASIGIQPEDIDIVYLTHFHGDHIAGLVDAEGQIVYTNARYVTLADEWNEWVGDKWSTADNANYDMMQSLRDKFTLVADGDAVVDGVRVVALPGHTLGQSGLLIESNGDRLIHLADVLHSESQFTYTHWHFLYDSDPELAVKTRERILKACADDKLLTFFYHLAFPGLGYIQEDDNGFTWHPIA